MTAHRGQPEGGAASAGLPGMSRSLRSESDSTHLSHEDSVASSVYTPSAHLLASNLPSSSQWDDGGAPPGGQRRSAGDLPHPLQPEFPRQHGAIPGTASQQPARNPLYEDRGRPQLPPPDSLPPREPWSAYGTDLAGRPLGYYYGVEEGPDPVYSNSSAAGRSREEWALQQPAPWRASDGGASGGRGASDASRGRGPSTGAAGPARSSYARRDSPAADPAPSQARQQRTSRQAGLGRSGGSGGADLESAVAAAGGGASGLGRGGSGSFRSAGNPQQAQQQQQQGGRGAQHRDAGEAPSGVHGIGGSQLRSITVHRQLSDSSSQATPTPQSTGRRDRLLPRSSQSESARHASPFRAGSGTGGAFGGVDPEPGLPPVPEDPSRLPPMLGSFLGLRSQSAKPRSMRHDERSAFKWVRGRPRSNAS